MVPFEDLERLRQRDVEVQRRRHRLADFDQRGQTADLLRRAARIVRVAGAARRRRGVPTISSVGGIGYDRIVVAVGPPATVFAENDYRHQSRRIDSGRSAAPIIRACRPLDRRAFPLITSSPPTALPRLPGAWLEAERARALPRAGLSAPGRGEDADPAAPGPALEVVLRHRPGGHRRRRRPPRSGPTTGSCRCTATWACSRHAGVDLLTLFRQLLGRTAASRSGRDRTFHFGALDHHIVGMISHLGAMLPVADGLALAVSAPRRAARRRGVHRRGRDERGRLPRGA